MFAYGAVPASFIGLHHFTASLNGRGEFERLKFSFSWKWGFTGEHIFLKMFLALPSKTVT